MKLLSFSEPVSFMTAIQLKVMPLTEMLNQIDLQERQASKEKRLGGEAAEVLDKLRSGTRITQGGG